MRRLGTYAATLATLTMFAASALSVTPVAAQAATPVPVGTVTTVKADCVGGGSVAMTQEWLDGGGTHVDVAGNRVRNGKWRGGYTNHVNSPDPVKEQAVRVTASGRQFTKSFEVADATRSASLVMFSGRHHVCAAFVIDRPKVTLVASPRAAALVRYGDSGEVTTRGFVTSCKNGTRWRFTVTVSFGSLVQGAASGRYVCHDNQVRVPKSVMSVEGDRERPSRFKVVARSSTGTVQRLSYRTTGVAAPARLN